MGAGPARTRLQTLAARGLPPFVGRQAELAALHQALAQARAGHGQVVAVIGEPGVGKTRLFHEFTHTSRPQGWLLLESRSTSYGKATWYLPVIALLKAYVLIEDRDDGRHIREKLTGRLLTLEPALGSTMPAFLALLEVPVEDPAWQALDPAQRRQRTLDALKRLFRRESQVQPRLLVFENLHWIDAETQTFLDGLVESLPAAHLLLLVNYRPEYHHGWGTKTYSTQLRLDPLSPTSAEVMLQRLLGDDAGLASLKARLIERTQGNPFFLEESVRTLVETQGLVGDRGAYRLARALPSIQVPATVQAVLAARIDRLPPEEKQLLQTASIIGTEVPLVLLQAVAEGPEGPLRLGLSHLQAAEFLSETRLFPEIEYTFKCPARPRARYGQWRCCPAGAGEPAPGRRLHAQGDYQRAIDCLGQTVAALDGARRRERSGQVFLPTVQSHAWLAWCHADLGTFAEGRALVDEGLRVAEAVAHPASLMMASWGIGLLAFRQGDLPRALPRLEQSVNICQDADLPLWFPWIAPALGAAYTLGGRIADAVPLLTQAIEQTTAMDMIAMQALCHLSLGEAHALAGRLEEAYALAERALALAREHHERGNEAYALRLLGEIAARREPSQRDQAQARYRQALALAEELGMRPLVAHCHLALGTLSATIGRRAEARTEPSTAIDLYRAMDMRFWLPQAEVALAQLEARWQSWRTIWPHRDTRPKSVSQGRYQCRRAGLGVESHAHLLSAKEISEKMGVGAWSGSPNHQTLPCRFHDLMRHPRQGMNRHEACHVGDRSMEQSEVVARHADHCREGLAHGNVRQ